LAFPVARFDHRVSRWLRFRRRRGAGLALKKIANLFGDSLRRALSHHFEIHVGGNAMLKTTLVAAFILATAFAPASAGSQDLCNDAHMKQMDDMIAKMTDPAKQKEATMHLDMSKAEMKKGNTAECMKHMEETHKAMGL
jgi:hypothetical protein